MGETLAAGSDVIEPLAAHLEVDMADWWDGEPTFFELVRDREVALALVAEVAATASPRPMRRRRARP